MEHHAGSCGSPGSGNGNYTFTDHELQSLLTSLDQGTPFEQDLLGIGGGGSAALQFLPHLPTSHGSPDAAAALFVPNDLAAGLSLDVGPPHLHMPLPLVPLSSAAGAAGAAGAVGTAAGVQHQQPQTQLPPVSRQHVHIHQPPTKQRQQRPARAAAGRNGGTAAMATAAAPATAAVAATAAAAAPGKQPHSQVEKQRRDRINHLIDELRELVPPQPSAEPSPAAEAVGGSGGDSRRPKHLVLSDTIRLIKQLQLQVAGGQQHWPAGAAAAAADQPWAAGGEAQAEGLAALPMVGVQHPLGYDGPQQQEQQGHSMDGVEASLMALDVQGQHAPAQQQPDQQDAAEAQLAQETQQGSESCGTRRSCDHPELPAAPGDDAAAVCGVTVESEGGTTRCVKVTCPDRHGLLADVVRALLALPLEITTAAVTTRRDHIVYDVFQVDVRDPSLTSEAIIAAVEGALRLPGTGDKKRPRAYLSPVASREALWRPGGPHRAMATVPVEAVVSVLKQLSHDIRDLDVGASVDRHQKLPVVQFLRDYVAANKPVVLTSVVSHWPAFSNWTDDYLCQLAGDTEVTVALTPNGRADAVTPLPGSGGAGLSCASSAATSPDGGSSPTAAAAADGDCEAAGGRPSTCFALPHQVKLPLRDFLLLLRSSREQPACAAQGPAAASGGRPGGGGRGVVPYLQYQNSSLTAEVPQLLGDVDLLLSWATQAFGGLPEAVNLWIGDERSVTSWHKDPFENIYAVVAGSKTFTLMPPAEVYRMRMRQYSQATYKPAAQVSHADESSEAGVEELVSGAVPLAPVLHDPPEWVLWSSVLPTPDSAAAGGGARPAAPAAPDPARAAEDGEGGAAAPTAAPTPDLFSDPSLPPPLKVTVKAGEALYLPAMWWHQVEQEPDASGRAIAVNYWYDMRFDARQAYLQAVERLAELLGLNEPAPPPPPPLSTRSSERGEQPAQLRPPYHAPRAFG